MTPQRPKAPKSSRPPKAKRAKAEKSDLAGGRAKPGPERGSSGAGRLLVTFASLSFAALAGFLVVVVLYPSRPGPGHGRDVEIVIEPGETADSLAERLADAGLVSSAKLFALYLRLTNGRRDLVPGTHLLSDEASARDLFGRLSRHGGAHTRVTFPEGFTRFDMAKRLQDRHICPLRGFLEKTKSSPLVRELGVPGDSMEGYLFPATYDLPLDSDPEDVIRKMKAEFDKRYAQLEPRHEGQLLELAQTANIGPREIVILASMIEKETSHDDDRPNVSSVFINRLRAPEFHPRLLQSDPTSGYGCLVMPERIPSCLGFTGKITPAINNDAENPYSTYKHEGLPPGPIANPGAKALEAAMAPAATHYFYFVARGEGRSTFSESYTQHNAAIRDGRGAK